MSDYENMVEQADKLLQPDGSITTRSGKIVESADEDRAKVYNKMYPMADKLLQPDGSVITRSDIGGSGGLEIITLTGGSSQYKCTTEDGEPPVKGKSYTIIPHVNSNDINATLSMNGAKASYFRRRGSSSGVLVSPYMAMFLRAETPQIITWQGQYWILESIVQSANFVKEGSTGLTTIPSGQVLVGNGTNPVTTKAIDTTVTEGSNNLVTSDAVAKAIAEAIANL